MILSLNVKHFTVFSEANLTFGKNLNVFVGENGTGKSHLLKLAYSLLAVAAQGKHASNEPTPQKTFLRGAIARKLVGVFRPDNLGRLTQRSRRGSKARGERMTTLREGEIDLAEAQTSILPWETTNAPGESL